MKSLKISGLANEGAPKAIAAAYLPSASVGLAIASHWLPWPRHGPWARQMQPLTIELMTTAVLSIGLTAKFDPPANGHSFPGGIGVSPGRSRPKVLPWKGAPGCATWKKS